MSVDFASKYRAHTWDDVVEQSTITTILKKQIQTNTLRHCYLFAGPSGDGKTTVARIFASAVNQGIGTPIELDAASNNGVDAIRAIIDASHQRSVEGQYKVFIIDEAHMITTAGYNAFLKCLEEPSAYTIFILCTTDPQKIPQTVLNRLQRFNFSKITAKGIVDRLSYVCAKESILVESCALDTIANLSDGCLREALNMLDKCAAFSSSISLTTIEQVLRIPSHKILFDLINSFVDQNVAEMFKQLELVQELNYDLKLFVDRLLQFSLDIVKYSIFKDISLTKIPEDFRTSLDYCIAFDNAQKYYLYVVDKLLQLKQQIKNDSNVKLTVESVFLQLVRGV